VPEKIQKLTERELSEGGYTAGMVRHQAFVTDSTWSGLVTTDAGATSGWHHHGDYETTIYVLTGKLLLESGPEGKEVVEAGPGDFVRLPKNTVHRESNPSKEESRLIVVRAGQGDPVFNVEGPELER
jgi:uncharacterized RmlC-like cupin family protein